MTSRFHSASGDDWAYEVAGRGKPVLWLHGFTGSRRSWDSVVERIADRFLCVTVDMLGHGESSAPIDPARYSMDAAVSTLHALMRHLGYLTYACVGYSMGGRVALSLAHAHPEAVTRLVLESASPGLDGEDERAARVEADERLAERIETFGVPAFVDQWQNLPLFATQANLSSVVKERQRAIRMAHQPTGLAGSLRGMGTGAQPSLWSDLERIAMPTLLVTGSLDEKFTGIGRAMQRRLPRAAQESVAQAGHTVHLEQPEAYMRIVTEFLMDGEA